MNILGNPILSRNFMYSNLSLSDKGLHYNLHVRNDKGNILRSQYIFVTDDPKRILELIGLDYDEVFNADEQEFFEMIFMNPNFRTGKFVNWNVDQVQLSGKFSKFLNDRNVSPAFQYNIFRIQPENLFERFEGFERAYNKAVIRLDNPLIRKKIDGKVILSAMPDYDKTKLSTTLPKFRLSFPSNEDFMDFLIENSTENIIQKFLEVTE